ncbi:MAG: hypothetical protein QMD78_04620 [Methanocellales archaeon]|nr:hypothetical protein [Methanocellales archaeon]
MRMYGLHAGKNIASSFVKLPATKEEVVELDFTFVHHQLGWYNTHQFEFDGEKGKIVIDYSCFAEPILAQKGKQDKPVCYYLVGFSRDSWRPYIKRSGMYKKQSALLRAKSIVNLL